MIRATCPGWCRWWACWSFSERGSAGRCATPYERPAGQRGIGGRRIRKRGIREPGMAVEGSLDLFRLPEILQMISQQHKTGILTIQGQQDIVAVSFLGGKIVAADSLAHTVEEGLSKLLVSEGLIGAAEFESANAENQGLGGRLLDLL